MSKINELLGTIKSGARTNKYKIIYPELGEDFDIVCNASSNPGKELGTVDVFIKGRKFQYASENTDDGTWECTIYNTDTMFHRLFFLQLLNKVHSFTEPEYMNDHQIPESQMARTNISLDQESRNASVWDVGPKSKNKTSISKINESLARMKKRSGYSIPWYMQDIIIQQLDHNENVISNTILHNAFVTSVSNIDYTDEVGEVSTSTISFTYSGVSYI